MASRCCTVCKANNHDWSIPVNHLACEATTIIVDDLQSIQPTLQDRACGAVARREIDAENTLNAWRVDWGMESLQE